MPHLLGFSRFGVADIQVFHQQVALDDHLVRQQLAVVQHGNRVAAHQGFRRGLPLSKLQHLAESKGFFRGNRGDGIGYHVFAGIDGVPRQGGNYVRPPLRLHFQPNAERAVHIQPAGAGGAAIAVIGLGGHPRAGRAYARFDREGAGKGLAELAAPHTAARLIQIQNLDDRHPIHQHPVSAELLRLHDRPEGAFQHRRNIRIVVGQHEVAVDRTLVKSVEQGLRNGDGFVYHLEIHEGSSPLRFLYDNICDLSTEYAAARNFFGTKKPPVHSRS